MKVTVVNKNLYIKPIFPDCTDACRDSLDPYHIINIGRNVLSKPPRESKIHEKFKKFFLQARTNKDRFLSQISCKGVKSFIEMSFAIDMKEDFEVKFHPVKGQYRDPISNYFGLLLYESYKDYVQKNFTPFHALLSVANSERKRTFSKADLGE